MVHLAERLIYLAIGGAIGFVLGYMVRSLRRIDARLEGVEKIKKPPNDAGFVRNPIILDIVLLLVVLMTAWAAVSSQLNSNKLADAQHTIATNQVRQDRLTSCTSTFLSETIVALNERTTYTQEQADANVQLQKAQAQFLGLLFRKQPPVTREESYAAAQKYFNALTSFIEVNAKSNNKVSSNPYPTNDEFRACIDHK